MRRAFGKQLAYFFVGIAVLIFTPLAFSAAHTVNAPGTHIIHMDANGFSPAVLEVEQGERVIFENVDSRERWPASNIHPTHTVYPGSGITKCGTNEAAHIFDACHGLESEETYSFVFDEPGRWRFHDHLVPTLTGEIIVHAGEGSSHSETNGSHEDDDRSLAAIVDGWLKSIAQSLANFLERIFSKPADVSEVSIVEIADEYDELASVVRSAGPEAVMEKLLEETGGGSALDCHQEAHQVGRVSYEMFGAKVFEKGDAACHSGYYHGAMEAFLSERGTENLAVNIEELCNIFETRFGIFECLHGVGHGVMAYENYDLPGALDDCDELGDVFSRRSCYGGAFMENVVAGQGQGAIPGHDTEWVNRTDMHYPCDADAVSGSYERQYECYQMQTSWMLTLTGYDFEQVAGECQSAPENMVPVCYKSYGRDAAGHTLRNPEKILALCANVPERGYDQCVEGAVNVIIDFWGPALEGQAEEFCEAVPKESSRERCLSVVESRLPQLFGER